MEKKCKKCGVVKAEEEFWKSPRYSSGRMARCSTCMGSYQKAIRDPAVSNERSKAYYRQNREKLIPKMRTYYREHREDLKAAQRARYAANPEYGRNYQQSWYAANRMKPEYKAKTTARVREWNRANKWAPRLCANRAVALAVRCKLLRPLPCERCGTTERIHAHHHKGYTLEHWFSVQWLCPMHHKEAHGRKHWV